MSETTNIAWCDSTFNPWIGCTKVSPACDHCYAERFGRRVAVRWGSGESRRRTAESTWKQPLRWQLQAEAFRAKHSRRRRVFCASVADVFDNEVPAHWRWDLFRLIATTPNLDWLLLTKRIGNARNMLNDAASAVAGEFVGAAEWDRSPWPNVWIGATICNQAEANRDIPKLLQVPGARRFLSIEPMLGSIDLTEWLWGRGVPCATCPKDADCDCGYERRTALGEPTIDWVICGGESGPQARPMHPDWARSLRDQCVSAGVPFTFKQWGEWCPRGPESLGYPSIDGVPRFRMTDAGHNGQDLGSRGGNDVWMNRAGKRAAGRLLDGVEHLAWPESVAS